MFASLLMASCSFIEYPSMQEASEASRKWIIEDPHYLKEVKKTKEIKTQEGIDWNQCRFVLTLGDEDRIRELVGQYRLQGRTINIIDNDYVNLNAATICGDKPKAKYVSWTEEEKTRKRYCDKEEETRQFICRQILPDKSGSKIVKRFRY